MFGLGLTEILLVLVLVLILFGAGKLPRVMGDIGKGLRSFKSGLQGEDEKKSIPPPGDKPDPV
ncbi:MAG: twin-arginine translocase TatA/TatE family subunit [Pseudomonadota bacterium]|nr:twin-arginine translocase TatA/TatE family subunit [Pseudomonadota bacterium]